jgi:hypothetical protein
MAFKQGSKTKKWQIKAKPTWHHFGEKINWFEPKKKKKKKELKRRTYDLKDQDAKARVQIKDSICLK